MIGIIGSVPTYLLDDQCNAAVRARIKPERDPDVMFINFFRSVRRLV
jgi:hypothetical protein